MIQRILTMIAGMLMIAACGSKTDTEQSHEAEKEPDGIIIEKDDAEAAGIKTQKTVAGQMSDVIHVSGRILTTPADEMTISATVAGMVRMPQSLTSGTAVAQGQTIASISSKGLQEGDAAQKARIEYEAARKQYERDAQLVKDHIVSEKHFEESKRVMDNARLAYEALGAARGDGTRVSARMSGYVKEVMVKDGDYVAVGQPMVTLTRSRSLYLRAEVPPRHVGKASQVVSARFRLSASDTVYDLSQLNGRKLASAKEMDRDSHYLPITFEMDNRGGLVAGDLAEIWLVCGQRQNVMSVPVSALTEEQGLHFVYVLKDADDEHMTYRKQEVTLGATDGERVEIVSGLRGGEDVVVSGAMNVRLAGASGAIPAHGHEH